MKQILLILAVALFSLAAKAQEGSPPLKLKGNAGGLFSIGMRSTISLFGNQDWSNVGMGVGGHFRFQLFDRVNTEWFADYITNDIEGAAHRQDAHIGWSVMFYPLPKNDDYSKLMKPFIEVGHCFDYTKVTENADRMNTESRLSTALQAGLGTHFNLTPHFDLTVKAQYMLHLGADIHADVLPNEVHIEKEKGLSAEGHLLVTFSVNYKIVDLWDGSKKKKNKKER